MMFTTKALAHGLITQGQANEIEDWIEEALIANEDMTVPDHLNALVEKISLFNFDGKIQ